MDKTKCPICNKTGIPDFLKEDVVCPCCNSDLSVYRKLYALRQNQQAGTKSRWLKYVLCPFVLIALNIGLWAYFSSSQKPEDLLSLKEQISQKNNEIVQLTDSIQKLTTVISRKEKPTNSTLWYVVRRGDSFCKISKIFLGTESDYMEIVKLNGLQNDAILQPGDSIRIK